MVYLKKMSGWISRG